MASSDIQTRLYSLPLALPTHCKAPKSVSPSCLSLSHSQQQLRLRYGDAQGASPWKKLATGSEIALDGASLMSS